jgi:superfamily II DNA helicase RecQ
MAPIGTVERIARRELGFEGGLFPYQRQAVSSLLDGRDALVVQPTGGGKSAVYHVAGAQLDGPVVVVSPLQALQRDQAGAIDRSGLGEARVINAATTRTAGAKACRWQVLTGWFGEPMAEPCGHCDVCDAGRSRPAGEDLGQVLVHGVFGRGLVVADEGDNLTVSFDDAGVRTLSRQALDEAGLVG